MSDPDTKEFITDLQKMLSESDRAFVGISGREMFRAVPVLYENGLLSWSTFRKIFKQVWTQATIL